MTEIEISHIKQTNIKECSQNTSTDQAFAIYDSPHEF